MSRGYGFDHAQVDALRSAYLSVRKFLAPVIVRTAADMMTDLAGEMGVSSKKGIFLKRDAMALALASRALEPQLFDERCHVITVSRLMAELAVRDVEARGVDVSAVASMRYKYATKEVPAADAVGARDRLATHIASAGVDLSSNAEVVLFDMGTKGTVQSLLSAAFSDVVFRGKYFLLSEHPDDPFVQFKKGYAFHWRKAEHSTGKPFFEVPDEDSALLAHNGVLSLFEDLLNGPVGPVLRFTDEGLLQRPGRIDPFTTVIPNRHDVGVLAQPLLREAIKVVSLYAVADLATEVAKMRDAGMQWQSHLDAQVADFYPQARAWITHGAMDDEFERLSLAFVGRDDDIRKAVAETFPNHSWRDAFDHVNLPEPALGVV